MLKILFVVSSLKKSGPLFVVENIIKYLSPSKNSAAVLALSTYTGDSMQKNFSRLGVEVSILGLKRKDTLFLGKKKFNDFISEKKPDVIHTHGLRADFLSVLVRGGKSFMSTIHNFPLLDYPMTYGKIRGFFIAKAHLYIIRRMGLPVFCSKTNFNYLGNINPNSTYVPNGIDHEIFKPISIEEKKRERAKLGFLENDIIFISVGNLNSGKNPETIIRAFLDLEFSNRYKLVFLGTGPLAVNCKKMSENNPNIIFKGHVNNVTKYLAISDFFVSASLAEGLPNSVLEAMSCGLPVLLSNIEPHKEILKFNSNAGCFFETKNYKDCAFSLSSLLSRDYEKMSSAAKKIIKERFTAEKMSRSYENIYANITRL